MNRFFIFFSLFLISSCKKKELWYKPLLGGDEFNIVKINDSSTFLNYNEVYSNNLRIQNWTEDKIRDSLVNLIIEKKFRLTEKDKLSNENIIDAYHPFLSHSSNALSFRAQIDKIDSENNIFLKESTNKLMLPTYKSGNLNIDSLFFCRPYNEIIIDNRIRQNIEDSFHRIINIAPNYIEKINRLFVFENFRFKNTKNYEQLEKVKTIVINAINFEITSDEEKAQAYLYFADFCSSNNDFANEYLYLKKALQINNDIEIKYKLLWCILKHDKVLNPNFRNLFRLEMNSSFQLKDSLDNPEIFNRILTLDKWNLFNETAFSNKLNKATKKSRLGQIILATYIPYFKFKYKNNYDAFIWNKMLFYYAKEFHPKTYNYLHILSNLLRSSYYFNQYDENEINPIARKLAMYLKLTNTEIGNLYYNTIKMHGMIREDFEDIIDFLGFEAEVYYRRNKLDSLENTRRFLDTLVARHSSIFIPKSRLNDVLMETKLLINVLQNKKDNTLHQLAEMKHENNSYSSELEYTKFIQSYTLATNDWSQIQRNKNINQQQLIQIISFIAGLFFIIVLVGIYRFIQSKKMTRLLNEKNEAEGQLVSSLLNIHNFKGLSTGDAFAQIIKEKYPHDNDVKSLSSLLDYTKSYVKKLLSNSEEKYILLSAEIDTLNDYFTTIKISKDKKYELKIPSKFELDSYNEFRILANSLQSIVENALNYSKIDELNEFGYVKIELKKIDDTELEIKIIDNGTGTIENRKAELGVELKSGLSLRLLEECSKKIKVNGRQVMNFNKADMRIDAEKTIVKLTLYKYDI